MGARLLAHPLTSNLDVDDPRTTCLRQHIIRSKSFLRQIYQQWYEEIANAVPSDGQLLALELGSGGGFMDEFIPHMITSDVFYCPGVAIVLNGCRLPFADATLRAVLMTDVLHHLPNPRRFFAETARCVPPNGRIAMVEPWVTPWSRIVYQNLHHEPFQPDARDWGFPPSGPLSGANSALPWIIFERDRAQFEDEFPEWRIREIKLMMPFRYLLSGGVSMRSLMPGYTYRLWRGLEDLLKPWLPKLAMFAKVVLHRMS